MSSAMSSGVELVADAGDDLGREEHGEGETGDGSDFVCLKNWAF